MGSNVSTMQELSNSTHVNSTIMEAGDRPHDNMTSMMMMMRGNSSVDEYFDFNNESIEGCPQTDSESEFMLQKASFWLAILQGITCLLGIGGNAFSIFLLSRKELHNSFNQLLAALAAFDLIYLFLMLLEAMWKVGMPQPMIVLYLYPYVLHPLNSISLTGSMYMTMAIAIERFIAVYHPLDYNRVMTDARTHKKRLAKYLVPVTVWAVVINATKFLESELYTNPETGEVTIEPTELRISGPYVIYYHNWTRLFLLGLIPLSVISFLNLKIYIAVRSRRGGRKRHDEHLSVILMMIVMIFIFSNLPRVLLNMIDIMVFDDIQRCRNTSLMGIPQWVLFLGFCSHEILCLNSSANLFIYSVVGTQFREVMFGYLCSCRKKGPRSPTDGAENQDQEKFELAEEKRKMVTSAGMVKDQKANDAHQNGIHAQINHVEVDNARCNGPKMDLPTATMDQTVTTVLLHENNASDQIKCNNLNRHKTTRTDEDENDGTNQKAETTTMGSRAISTSAQNGKPPQVASALPSDGEKEKQASEPNGGRKESENDQALEMNGHAGQHRMKGRDLETSDDTIKNQREKSSRKKSDKKNIGIDPGVEKEKVILLASKGDVSTTTVDV